MMKSSTLFEYGPLPPHLVNASYSLVLRHSVHYWGSCCGCGNEITVYWEILLLIYNFDQLRKFNM